MQQIRRIAALTATTMTVVLTLTACGATTQSPVHHDSRMKKAAGIGSLSIVCNKDIWTDTRPDSLKKVTITPADGERGRRGMIRLTLTGAQLVTYLDQLDQDAHPGWMGPSLPDQEALTGRVYDALAPPSTRPPRRIPPPTPPPKSSSTTRSPPRHPDQEAAPCPRITPGAGGRFLRSRARCATEAGSHGAAGRPNSRRPYPDLSQKAEHGGGVRASEDIRNRVRSINSHRYVDEAIAAYSGGAYHSLVIDACSMIGRYTERFTVPVRPGPEA